MGAMLAKMPNGGGEDPALKSIIVRFVSPGDEQERKPERNLRAIEVLVDQEVVRSGRAANQPWKFYDLGHGYCTYDFFEQCPHRMPCAKCNFYLPKHSTQVQLLEGKASLVQLHQEIPIERGRSSCGR